MKLSLLFVAVGLATSVPCQAATLTGNQITWRYDFPFEGVPFSLFAPTSSVFIVGPGVESFGIFGSGGPFISADFSDTSLTLTFLPDSIGFSGPATSCCFPVTFNGLEFERLDPSTNFPSIVTVSGLDASRVNRIDDILMVNFMDRSFLRDDQIVINFGSQDDLNAPSVPEPAAWMMMIAGFGVVGSAMRRKQKVTAGFVF